MSTTYGEFYPPGPIETVSRGEVGASWGRAPEPNVFHGAREPFPNYASPFKYHSNHTLPSHFEDTALVRVSLYSACFAFIQSILSLVSNCVCFTDI